MIEICRPAVQAIRREFGVFSGSGGEPCEVPARWIRLSNHDDPNALTWPEIQRLGRAEEAIFVQRFDGTHAYNVVQEVDHGSRSIHVARAAQRTGVQLRDASARECHVCCKPELASDNDCDVILEPTRRESRRLHQFRGCAFQ